MNSEFNVAVHALVYLDHKGDFVSSEELADNICTNPARVRKILSRLKQAGLVEAREGSVGGFRFIGDARAVTLAEVAEALKTRFVSTNWRSGDVDKECLVSSGMGRMMDGIMEELNAGCYELMKKRTIAGIEEQIFQNKKEE
ncbi:RrF2 family transcriptional regulator [Cuneatibacter caecimuris]|uniref:BadM/Rrf2 family transcriptional regulator n=1 Tax=Cuneatibacter caecimuris TaxID=1796618 RepID=A0A4Q7PPD3_9FIRM|nr:Rrf2 family transcriptional regulator [Cuneatibacter caecimuris]RZT02772.1 BadM/Rrf2 family transcriptional regulator [Cuneatibacter caecimuris]